MNMFAKAKDKTKSVTLKLRAKAAPSKPAPMAGIQTLSLTTMPMADQHGVLNPPKTDGPNLYVMGKAPKPKPVCTAKKSLQFDSASEEQPPLTPTAPPITENSVEDGEEIVEHDTATQTSDNTNESVSAELPTTETDTTTPTETTNTDQLENPEEVPVRASSRTLNTKGHLRKTKKFRRVFLTKSVKGKQFRPRSPISNTAAYLIVCYEATAQFKLVAKELNGLVQFFNLNTIAPFMYDQELQYFIADYRRQPCKRMPFLRFAMETIFHKFSLQDSPNVNSPTGREFEEGEWVEIDDDSDDEISFPNRNLQQTDEDPELDDTVQLNQSARQQDEYPDNEYYDNTVTVIFTYDPSALNDSMYYSADENDIENRDDYDTYNTTQYYTPEQTEMTDKDLYGSDMYNTQSNIASNSQVVESHAEDLMSFDQVDSASQGAQADVISYPDTGYETEIGTQVSDHLIEGIRQQQYYTDNYTYVAPQDEFMGQYNDIDEPDYNTATQAVPVTKPRPRVAVPQQVLIHDKPVKCFQEPLVVHQVQGMFGIYIFIPKETVPTS